MPLCSAPLWHSSACTPGNTVNGNTACTGYSSLAVVFVGKTNQFLASLTTTIVVSLFSATVRYFIDSTILELKSLCFGFWLRRKNELRASALNVFSEGRHFSGFDYGKHFAAFFFYVLNLRRSWLPSFCAAALFLSWSSFTIFWKSSKPRYRNGLEPKAAECFFFFPNGFDGI